MHGYPAAMTRYGRFRGRAPLAEFWGFFLVFNIVSVVLYELLDPGAYGSIWPDLIFTVFVLIHVVPYCAVLARRLHDINASGWWSLTGVVPMLGLVMLIPAAFKGNIGPNQFGPDPLDPEAVATANLRTDPSDIRHDPPFTAAPVRAAEAVDIVTQFERLARLRDAGTLSAVEFETMKARLLEIGSAE